MLSSLDEPPRTGAHLPRGAKLFIVVCAILLVLALLYAARAVLSPFLWAILAAYLLAPVVRYLNVRGGLPRIWCVFLIYSSVTLALVAASRYLYPQVISEGTVFVEDIPRLEAALIGLVGPRPLGIDINSLVTQVSQTIGGYTSDNKSASHLLVNAFETFAKVFLFLVTTFYLLLDASRIRKALTAALPELFRPELIDLARRIHSTWMQYLRGELLLFALMATVSTIGLTLFGVPGAIFVGLLSGALELLPLVGPLTAGTVAVAVAYFNGSNPWGWSQIAYGGAIAVMYLILRQAEDYFVIPHVLGRAVRLHPLIILFSVAAGGVIGGLFGLIIAVPVAASLREIAAYLYAKLLDQPVLQPAVQTADAPAEQVQTTQYGSHAAKDSEPAPAGAVRRLDSGA